MSAWITYAEAADVLGCHVSNVPKLIHKGHLKSQGRVRSGSLHLHEVEALAEERRRTRESYVRKPHTRKRVDNRPDFDHEWLTASQVDRLLGVTRPAVTKRIQRERLPAVQSGGRWWVRRDLLEQVEAARLAARTRLP
jgi:excisionase family DNA binding protein